MSRKLVTIRKIKDLIAIENADLIELAMVDGWQVVVKKGDFKIGDLAFYFEIDSFLPLLPEFEFLRKSSYKKMNDKEGIRLKTIKLKGKISQGLLLPIAALENIIKTNPFKATVVPNFEMGEEFTEVLGVDKYEAPVPSNLAGNVAGCFPYFIPKTDEERIQNLWDEYTKDYIDNNETIIEILTQKGGFEDRIEELKNTRTINVIKNLEFEATIKLDGSSMTCFVVDTSKFETKAILKAKNGNSELKEYFGICSRNFELTETEDNAFWKVANENKIKEKLINFYQTTKRNIALQGELMGEGIQGNRENLKGKDFFCYKVFDIDQQRFLTRDERTKVLEQLEIKTVPFIENIKVFERFKNIEEILEYAEGKSLNHPIREGVVFKSLTLVNGNEISFKAISNKFLLKNEQ